MTEGARTLEPFRKDWERQAETAIKTMEANAPKTGIKLRPIGWGPEQRGCAEGRTLDLVAREFHFRGFKGAGGHVDKTVTVRLQRIVMIAFLRAMIEAPTIVVGFGDATYATYRSNAQQRALYDAYLDGGYLAAPPCSSFHELARSIDGYYWTERERAAMGRHGFHDLLPADPPHMTYHARG